MLSLPKNFAELSPSEIIQKIVEQLKDVGHDYVIEELKDLMQTAIEIELATIPVYLYTYYSLSRKAKSGLNTGEQLDDYGVFTNQSAGVIMSVAVEEMLHMSLSSNILFALGGQPQLYMHSPQPFPTNLPHHFPKGPDGKDLSIPLAPFSFEQMWHFLEIEYPKAYTDIKPYFKDGKLEIEWSTIGQFYKYITEIIKALTSDADFQVGAKNDQIQQYNYSPNNIDTIYPTQAFGPWGIPAAQGAAAKEGTATLSPTTPTASAVSSYPNQADAGDLTPVASKEEVLAAIKTICDQGEGYDATSDDADFDDPSHQEDSHYFKFITIASKLADYKTYKENYPPHPVPPTPSANPFTCEELQKRGLLYNFPLSPMTRKTGLKEASNVYYDHACPTAPNGTVSVEDFRAGLLAVSDLCNGVYSYMLILTETIFQYPDPEQRLFFNNAMHRSMIWVLDKLIQSMRDVEFIYKDTTYNFAPTFENFNLGTRAEAYGNLLALIPAANDGLGAIGLGAGDLESIELQINQLPDVSDHWK